MIEYLAVRDLDGDLPPGAVIQWMAVHRLFFDDQPVLTAVLRNIADDVAAHPEARVTTTRPVCLYLFTPAQLDDVAARYRTIEDPAHPERPYADLGAVVAVWRP